MGFSLISNKTTIRPVFGQEWEYNSLTSSLEKASMAFVQYGVNDVWYKLKMQHVQAGLRKLGAI